jgi:hypothetical protein
MSRPNDSITSEEMRMIEQVGDHDPN